MKSWRWAIYIIEGTMSQTVALEPALKASVAAKKRISGLSGGGNLGYNTASSDLLSDPNVPRNSTSQRLASNAGSMKLSRGPTSVSDLLAGLGFKTKNSTTDKGPSKSKLGDTKKLGRSGSMLAHSPMILQKTKTQISHSHVSASTNKLSTDEPSGLSRFLNFTKKGGSNAVLTEISENSPNLEKKGTVVSKREREATSIPKSNLSSKQPAGSSSAYDIRGPLNVQRRMTLDDYYLIRRVGKGGFATVFLVRLKGATGRYYALKAMKKSEVVRLHQEKQIMNEKNILLELKHWLLVELYNTFQTPSHLFMIMEFVCGGDLFTLLRKLKVNNIGLM